MPRKFFTPADVSNDKVVVAALLNKLERSRCQAWVLLFNLKQQIENEHQQQIDRIQELGQIKDEIPQHIRDEFKELYETSQRQIECPICTEGISADALLLTHCGHKYHKECIREHMAVSGNKCPTCRKHGTIQI